MIVQKHTRGGLTLLEVVLAMFIFLISSIAIWQLVNMGSERALDIREETRTSARCQSKMAELIVGATPLTASGGYTPFEDQPDLLWKVDAVESEAGIGLFNVKVFVKRELATGRTIESQISQIVLEPTMRGSSLDRSLPPVTATPTTDDPNADPNATTPSTTTPSTTTPSTTTAPSTTMPSTGGTTKSKGG